MGLFLFSLVSASLHPLVNLFYCEFRRVLPTVNWYHFRFQTKGIGQVLTSILFYDNYLQNHTRHFWLYLLLFARRPEGRFTQRTYQILWGKLRHKNKGLWSMLSAYFYAKKFTQILLFWMWTKQYKQNLHSWYFLW